uniref:SH3 domain-containing protein n=1 Tax=Steinernema glaseri TaxID=37863 RepID=A0A1I7ZK87_9BILA
MLALRVSINPLLFQSAGDQPASGCNDMMDKSLPPPPLPPKSRNDSLGAQLSTYRERPKPAGGFANTKSLFESGPVRDAFFRVATNPDTRSAAVHAAQKPAVRKVAASVTQIPVERNAAMAQTQSSKPPLGPKPQSGISTLTSTDSDLQKKKVASIVKNLDNFYQKQSTPPMPNVTKPLYPSLPDDESWQNTSTCFIPPPRTSSISSSQTFDGVLIPSVRSSSAQPDYLSSSCSAQQELDDLFGNVTSQKVRPARPPPPKFVNSHSHPNLNTVGQDPTSLKIREPHAIVKYPYKAAHKDELSCQPNDVVILQREVDDQWVFASNIRSGQRGIVPMSFLSVNIPLVPGDKTNTVDRSSEILTSSFDGLSMVHWSKSSSRMARALYDYKSPVQGDLQFFAGDMIAIIQKVDDGWYKGELRGRTGMFPANFVELCNTTTPYAPACSAARTVDLDTVTAAYDYSSDVSDDLSFKAGEVIQVVEYINEEWIRGRIGVREGMVPLTFVIKN